MGRKKKSLLNITAIRKAANGLGIVNNTVQQPNVYPVTECLQLLKNLFTKPDYERLTITSYAWMKLMAFIHLIGDYEISGFGRIIPNEKDDKNGIIIDFDIIRQEVKSAYVESDADAVLEFIMQIPENQRTEWILDWHSHVNMGTSPSGTDWDNYEEMLAARQHKQFPAMIVNKSGNVSAHQIICPDKHPTIEVSLQHTHLSDAEIEQIYAECKTKVQNKCTKAAVVTTYNSGANVNHSYTGTYYEQNYWNDDDWYERWEQGNDLKKNDNEYGTANPRVRDVDLTPQQQHDMIEAGFIFDEETGEAYDEDELCEECGKPLKTETELNAHICFNCFQKAMNEEAIAYHQQLPQQ